MSNQAVSESHLSSPKVSILQRDEPYFNPRYSNDLIIQLQLSIW